MKTIRRVSIAALAVAATVSACGSGGSTGTTSPGSSATSGGSAAKGDPVKVGLVYSKTGLLSSYGEQYRQGFTAGLDYATKGTGVAAGHKIEVAEADDAGDPAKAVSAAKDFIGKGYQILAGSTSSGVALQLAPLAEQNDVLFISGPAAADAITGINKHTFRSGRQTYQDILTAQDLLAGGSGKTVTVFAQDSAFGQANAKAVAAVLGKGGAQVSNILVPLSATDFTPFAAQVKTANPDLLFIAWAGTTAPAMYQSLDQQGVLTATKVVTGLDQKASWGTYGTAGDKIDFLSYYFPSAPNNPVNKTMVDSVTKAGGTPDIFTPDGFVAAQMIVHAVEQGSATDVGKMISTLEGWQFDAPKGQETVRGEDHAMLQSMYEAKLSGQQAQLTKTLPPDQVAPPVAAGK